MLSQLLHFSACALLLCTCAGSSISERHKVALQGTPLDGGVPRPKITPPWDWLFDSSATSCQKPEWDNVQYSVPSRVFLPIQFGFLAFVIVFFGRPRPIDDCLDTSLLKSQFQVEVQEPRVRRFDLDFARIGCVIAVVIEHSGGSNWTKRNTMFVLQWVLPYLYITSGISFVMSNKNTLIYSARLMAVLAVGVSANWCADMTIGRDWRGDFANTIFQMFYVVMLIVMSVIAAPLRHTLRDIARNPNAKNDWSFWAPTFFFGALTATAFVFFVYPDINGRLSLGSDGWMRNYAPVLRSAPLIVIQIAGLLFLCHLACLYRANSLVPWLILVHIYLPRVFIPWNMVGFPHNIELYIFAMVVESWKIKGHKAMVNLVHNYWPLLIFFLTIMGIPDIYGRCDLLPPNLLLERFRFYGIEMILALCLCVGAFHVDDPHNVTKWLNNWALFAYCTHVAFARLLPIPYGAVLTCSSAVFFYMANVARASGEQRKTSKHAEHMENADIILAKAYGAC